MQNNALILLVIFLGLGAGNCAADVQSSVERALPARQSVSLSVVDLQSGNELVGVGAHKPLKPASVMKIVTAAAALDSLGPEFRFATSMFYDSENSGNLKTLYIRGGGDPNLTLENLWLLVRRLRKLGIKSVGSVVLDDGGFATPHNRVGQRAYETGSSALALSFNSVSFDVCPGALKGAVRVSVDPWEAGVTLQGSAQTISGSGGVLSIDEVSQKDGLTYAIKGTFGINRPCETFYRSVDNPLSYFGTVFRRFAATLGISIAADPVAGSTPSTAHLLARQQSKPLSLVIEDMNHFSTNFIAEQILSAIGQSTTGNFDREVGLERMRAYAATLKIPAAECDFQDGSGLSHQNRLSAAAVTAILKHAASNAEYGIEFQKSLSVSKRNGTLRDRNFVQGALVRGKTGTLDGVSSLAGILRTKSGRSVVFAMLQNGPLGKDEASSAEEKVVGELFRLL